MIFKLLELFLIYVSGLTEDNNITSNSKGLDLPKGFTVPKVKRNYLLFKEKKKCHLFFIILELFRSEVKDMLMMKCDVDISSVP